MMPALDLSVLVLAAAIMIRVIFGIVFEGKTIVAHHFLDAKIYRDDRCEYIQHETYELSRKFDERVHLKVQTGFSNAVDHNGLEQDGIVQAGGKVVTKGQYIGRSFSTGELFVIDQKAFENIFLSRVQGRPTPQKIDTLAEAV